MKLVTTITTATAMALALGATAAQAQALRDAAAEFDPVSQPADWAYMQRTGAGCVTPGSLLSVGYNPAPGLSGYVTGPIPVVARNTSAGQVTFSTIKIDAGKLLMHPGTRGECAVVRFKAPSAGSYLVSITMKAVDFVQPNVVRAYVFGSGAPGTAVGGAETLNAAGSYGATKTFTRMVSVIGANRFIDVALDDGANPDPQGAFRFDSTQMEIAIRREGGPGNGNGNAGGNGSGNGGGVGGGGGGGNEGVAGMPVLNCAKVQGNPVSVNLSTGQPGWTLKLPNGNASAIALTPSMVPSPWTAVPGAQWVGPQGAPQTPGAYVYETRVRVLKCPNGQAAKLTAQFRADNVGTLTLINPAGAVIATMNQAGTANYGFLPASLSPAGGPGFHGWTASANGIYTIRMAVQNSDGPTGVAASIVLSR